MLSELIERLSDWQSFDTWIALTGALAAMACALPGTWLMLRRQALLGDALSHAVLPGIVVAYLGMDWLESNYNGATNDSSGVGVVGEVIITLGRQSILFLGAACSGVVAAVLTEAIQRWGRLDRSAALGVVFTSMFAFGLLLIRAYADRVHIDTDCVLYGSLEASYRNTIGSTGLPRAIVVNGVMLLASGLLVLVFFRELRLVAFDAELASSLGINSHAVSFVLMAVTAATVVAAFESVGAILVIAMLVVPPATARLLTDRLPWLLVLGPAFAALAAILGHAAALTAPSIICTRLGWTSVEDAGTAGMMAVMSGAVFLAAVIFSPKKGLIRSYIDQARLKVRIASEDILGGLYRRDERQINHELDPVASSVVREDSGGQSIARQWVAWFAQRRLTNRGLIRRTADRDELTQSGRQLAQDLVRSHRLWEAYMAKYFDLSGDHLHEAAERAEHYVDPVMQAELAAELDQPERDPHGKSIPPGAN